VTVVFVERVKGQRVVAKEDLVWGGLVTMQLGGLTPVDYLR